MANLDTGLRPTVWPQELLPFLWLLAAGVAGAVSAFAPGYLGYLARHWY